MENFEEAPQVMLSAELELSEGVHQLARGHWQVEGDRGGMLRMRETVDGSAAQGFIFKAQSGGTAVRPDGFSSRIGQDG